jgi:predicted nucleic acid-binding protein
MPGSRYVLDACVLYPVVVRDLLLTAATFDLFEPLWSAEIIEEMRRNVLADHPSIDAAAIDRNLIGPMTRTFPNASISGYETLVDSMDNQAKDRHVAAAALHAKADAIVTYNVRDFRGRTLIDAGIEIVTPPDLVARWLTNEPSIVARAVERMAQRKQRPPMSASEVNASIGHQQGFREVAEKLGPLLRDDG